ncbi:energy-coupling factor transporter transmembrane component T family protein [Arthrobacter globiformis]|uniref:energy-coupling factor transporter transmembrane component T family protein n=1 Tax=Arthrobacter globiformis TaxID=1665 RepID=UPI00278832A0|nr:energy-coupling factor transporter transmembrane component T [Arthrobacter globiformis]MDQ0864422.1 energy-coupling factor transport system permease protein [Arthrobacter globiformis]
MFPRLNPLTTLTAAVTVLVITTAAASWAVSLTVAIGAVLLAVAAGTVRRVLVASAAIIVPFWLSLLVIHGLFFPEGRSVLASWGPARVTAEGLSFALEMGLRTAAFVLVLMVFSFSVRVPELVAALTARRVPPQVGYVLASTLLLAPLVAARLEKVRQAQESRGLVVGPGIGSRAAAIRLQMVPLVLGLVHDAGIRAQALDARGFRSAGPRTSYTEVRDSAVQVAFRIVAIVLALAAVGWRIVESLSAGSLAALSLSGGGPG